MKSIVKNIKSFLIANKVLTDVNKNFTFKNLSYLPRWLVLFLDVCIVFFSGVVTYILFEGLNLYYIKTQYIVLGLLFYLTVNILFFWFFRTYSGIIRHSSYIDGLKIFFSQFSTFLLIASINFCNLYFNNNKIFLTTGIFFNSVLSFVLLFFYRIIVKQTFEYFFINNSSVKRIEAIIYGTNSNAIAVANALKSEVPSRFKLNGFIDKNNQNTTKRLLNLPIFKIKKSIPVLMRYLRVEAIIIADNTLSKEEKLFIVEECIQYNFKVYTLPLISDWDNKKEIAKNIRSFEIQDLLERKPIVLDLASISQKLNDKTILVTGAAGSIGSEIVRQIYKFQPESIILLDQAETPLHSLSLELSKLQKNINTHLIVADIKDKKTLTDVFSKFKPQIVYHAAAYKHVPIMELNPSQAIFTNVLGTKILADLSQEFSVERFVMISTDKAVNPSSVMGASKRIAEMYVQSKQFESNKEENPTKYITTRFGNVLGSNGSVVPLFTKQIIEGGPITITHPDIIRYFMTIPEACQLVLEACSMGEGGEIYIFDMGKPVKIIDLAKKMIRLAGYIPYTDIDIKIVGLRPGEKLYEELLNDSAKNLPTHHEKITRAIEISKDFKSTSQAIDLLIEEAIKGDAKNVVIKMKSIVPEYKSLNSQFEILN